ncbi:ankyrin repeat-containing protein BDA1-like [Cornus florida]|uniref:ankyrin repeat-containing protein BDA1-like n=1 Tax=Cornus florida TaxID=4283 RepID=UPI0028A20CD7|nr:ankyrin repeat-containing protein BDA1-like [Cornus florida]XP_059633786.1 ankyrin repeat-containing protein BDA1-like [Cornus florida]
MDRRLFEAAWTGNVEFLHKLMEDDPCLLNAVALAGGETPVHIACLAGHFSFVQEVMKLRQEFGRELNQDGLSLLHIASACGHVEIVKELVKMDNTICILEGRERRIPLHYAAIKGRVVVMRELLSANGDSIAGVTARGETALHLAVKNNQFEALRVLVEHLRLFKKEGVLNMKDCLGNTILHLAVSSKQYEVVELVLGEHVVTGGVVEVNPSNEGGLTPLDVLVLFQSEAGDREIEVILRRAGAMTAKDLHSLHDQAAFNRNQDAAANHNPSNDQSRTVQHRSLSTQLQEFFKYDDIKESPSKVRNTLLVIAILIATATYQAVLSPPGGVWQDDSAGSGNSKPHTAGRAVMGAKNWISYGLFLLFNSIGFFTSLHMINFLTMGFPLRLELQVSIFALIVTYDTCMTAIAPNSRISVFFTVISVVIPLLVPFVTTVVRNHSRRLPNALTCVNQATV